MNSLLAQPDKIQALIPSYTEQGDCTIIIRDDGSTTTWNVRLRAALARLARSQATDLAALKQNCCQTTNRSILQPLPLAPGLVLFPVKVRTPRIKGDNTTGYINLPAVAKVTAGSNQPHQAVVCLTCGQQVPIIWTTATVHKQMRLARLAAAYSPRSLTSVAQENLQTYQPELDTTLSSFINILRLIQAKLRASH